MAATTTDGPLTVRAQAKWVRMSARKARLVLDHIRGRTVPEARTILAFTQRAAATEIEKVLRSAVSNAEANHGLDGDELVVQSAFADEGPTLKRWKPRARGRVNRIRKRTCHVTVVLVEQEQPQARPRRRSRRAAEEAPASSPRPKAADKPKRRSAKPAEKKEKEAVS
jgi:large subunit ribosomal protein L22